MRDEIEMVRQFNKQKRPDATATQRVDELGPNARMLGCAEELLELAREADVAAKGEPDDLRWRRLTLMTEELGELARAMAMADEVETLDALSDLTYVVFGTAIALDLPLAAGFGEAHASNMTKAPVTELAGRNRDKGPDYRPADFARVLREHREREGRPVSAHRARMDAEREARREAGARLAAGPQPTAPSRTDEQAEPGRDS
jgi:NTP pyrophosphatase (non-canonical NTP hydrolase)